MAVAQGYGKTVTSGSVFAYDVADTRNSYRGEPTTNLNPYTLSDSGTDGSGQGTVGTRTILSSNHVSINDVNANTRQTHLISGLTGGATYTVSIEFKKISGTPTFRFQLQNYLNGAFNGTIKFTDTAEIGIEDKEGWQLASWTFTLGAGMNGLRIWYQDGADYTTYTHAFELRNPQLEQKSHATPYTPPGTTRSATQGLLPLVGNSTIDLSNVSFNSKSQIIFDGTNDDLRVQVSNSKTNITMEGVFYVNLGTTGTYLNNGNDSGGYCIGIGSLFNTQDNQITALFGGVRWILTGAYYEYTGYHHIVMTLDETSTPSIYVNGKLIGTYPGNPPNNVTPGTGFSIGSQWGIRYSNTICPVSKFYNRVLSANEIKQNYEFYNARLGNELDTYYFTVSNLAARYTHITGKGYTMPTTTPAYILYKKPSEQIVGVYSYRELSYDFIGSPPRLTKYGTQTIYSGGKYFTDVTVRKKKKDGTLSFGFPNGGTSQYGENFYKSIITPHIPK